MSNWALFALVTCGFGGLGFAVGRLLGGRAVRILASGVALAALAAFAYWLFQGYQEHRMAGLLAALAGVTFLALGAAGPFLAMVFAGRFGAQLRDR